VLIDFEIFFKSLCDSKLVELLYLLQLSNFLPFDVELLQDDPGQSSSDCVVELLTYKLHFKTKNEEVLGMISPSTKIGCFAVEELWKHKLAQTVGVNDFLSEHYNLIKNLFLLWSQMAAVEIFVVIRIEPLEG